MFLSLLFCSLILPHKYHTSLTRITHNLESQHLEIEMRVFTEDLERAVSGLAKKRTSLDHEDAQGLAFDYVKKHLMLSREDKSLALGWVGMEVGIKETWLFLEVPMDRSLEGVQILNTMLIKIGHQQINTVNLIEGEKKATLTFREGSRTETVRF